MNTVESSLHSTSSLALLVVTSTLVAASLAAASHVAAPLVTSPAGDYAALARLVPASFVDAAGRAHTLETV